MHILKNLYDEISSKYVIPPPEQGGILGIKNGIVCEYYHDASSNITNCAVYEPDVEVLNKKIEEWGDGDINFGGIVHSHLIGQAELSLDDKEYIKLLFNSLPDQINSLYFPIIIPETKDFISFVAERSKNGITIRPDEIHIIL